MLVTFWMWTVPLISLFKMRLLQLMARCTKGIQGLLQDPTANLESTTISPSTPTWTNTRPAKPKAAWAASQLAGPKVSHKKGGKPSPCRQNRAVGVELACPCTWGVCFCHSTKCSLKFLRRWEGLSPMKLLTIAYRWTGNQSHNTAGPHLQHSPYSWRAVELKLWRGKKHSKGDWKAELTWIFFVQKLQFLQTFT